jgi:hypothetical protein
MTRPLLDLGLSTLNALFPKRKQVKLTKLERRLLIFCCLIIVVFSYFLYDDSLFVTSCNSAQPQVAQLVGKKQDVRVKLSDNFTWFSAQEQDSFYAFDSLFTGEQSTAILKLNDGSTLRIDGQSLVVLAVENGQLLLDLKSGSLSGDMPPQSQLLVKTQQGLEKIGGNRSGQIRLVKSFAGSSLQRLDRGPASVSVAQPGEYYVRVFASNEDGDPISGSFNIEKMRYDLKNLLPAPELIRPFNDSTVFLQSDDNPYLWLTWKPLADAEIFIIEISKDPEFKNLIESASVSFNKESFQRYLMGKRIPYGKYFGRVKSISETEQIDSHWSKTNQFYLMHKKKEIFFE